MREEDYPSYDDISEDDKKKFLLKKGTPFFALAVIAGVLSLFYLFTGHTVSACFFLAALLIGAAAGITPLLFWDEETKEEYISSRLYRMNLEYQKRNGIHYTEEELDKLRFQNDPLFRRKVIEKVHKEEDDRYKRAVKSAADNVNKLQKQYDHRYRQLSDMRWEKVNPYLTVNPTEGKVIINGAECLFSELRGARVEERSGTRRESYEHHYTEEHTEKSRDLSIGGAIAGGLIAGPIGAVAGAVAFGKNKSEVVQEHKTDLRHRDIPVCNHLGVKVNLKGFETEIVLISSPADTSGFEYRHKLNEANEIVSALRVIASSPMPKNVLTVDQEPELILMYKDISEAKKQLDRVKEQTPEYRIPARYLIETEADYEEEDEIIDLTSDESTVSMPKQG